MVAPKGVTKMIYSLVMIFAPQIIIFVQSSERCVSVHRRVTIRVLNGFSMILPFKIANNGR
jgi:hypothetical protein